MRNIIAISITMLGVLVLGSVNNQPVKANVAIIAGGAASTAAAEAQRRKRELDKCLSEDLCVRACKTEPAGEVFGCSYQAYETCKIVRKEQGQ